MCHLQRGTLSWPPILLESSTVKVKVDKQRREMSRYKQKVKTHDGRCYVEKGDLLDSLLVSHEDSTDSPRSVAEGASISSQQSRGGQSISGSRKSTGAGSPETKSPPLKGVAGGGSVNLSLKGSTSSHETAAKMLLERTRLRKSTQSDKEFARLQDCMKDSLSFLDEIDRELNLVDETKRTKTRRQFEDWNKNVHGKIQEKVLSKVDSRKSKELHNRNLESYDKFLEITNRKSAIFRDIIIESEYDPLEANRNAIKANFKRIKDPLQIDRQKAEEEMAMVGLTLEHGSKKNDRLSVEMWASGKIESTPYGMFAAMMEGNDSEGGTSEESSTGRVKGQPSKVVFDDYNYPVGRKAVDREMPKPKPKTRIIYADPKAAATDPRTGLAFPLHVQEEIARIGMIDN